MLQQTEKKSKEKPSIKIKIPDVVRLRKLGTNERIDVSQMLYSRLQPYRRRIGYIFAPLHNWNLVEHDVNKD